MDILEKVDQPGNKRPMKMKLFMARYINQSANLFLNLECSTITTNLLW